METVPAERVSVEPLADGVVALQLAAPTLPRWQAGQHLMVGVAGARLPYSIANPPNGAGDVLLAVKRDSDKPAVAALVDSDAPIVLGAPRGALVAPEGVPRLLIGQGTGVAPLRALWLEARAAGIPTLLLAGFRRPEDRLWHEELAASASAQAQCLLTLSQPSASWSGAQGYVQDHVATAVKDWPYKNEATALVCGRSAMALEVTKALETLGIDAARIKVEAYG